MYVLCHFKEFYQSSRYVPNGRSGVIMKDMEIFTIQDILQVFLPTLFETFGAVKDAFAMAILDNLGSSIISLLHGNWVAIVSVAGALVLAWRLKSWLVGFALHSISR